MTEMAPIIEFIIWLALYWLVKSIDFTGSEGATAGLFLSTDYFFEMKNCNPFKNFPSGLNLCFNKYKKRFLFKS